MKHNPTPTQADLDTSSHRCVEEGILLATELLRIYDVWGSGRKEMSGEEFANMLMKKLNEAQIENLLDKAKKLE